MEETAISRHDKAFERRCLAGDRFIQCNTLEDRQVASDALVDAAREYEKASQHYMEVVDPLREGSHV